MPANLYLPFEDRYLFLEEWELQKSHLTNGSMYVAYIFRNNLISNRHWSCTIEQNRQDSVIMEFAF